MCASQPLEDTSGELADVHRIMPSRPGFISTSFPFGGGIAGHFVVFRGLPRRRGIARETPETLGSVVGGPNGFPGLVNALTVAIKGVALAA